MKISLTEAKLRNIIRQAVNESMMEGTNSTDICSKWDECVEKLGERGMIDALYNYLSSDEIADFLDYADRNYDLWY